MFKPRTIDSEPVLYDAAVKILMRRAHSVSEMKKALSHQGKYRVARELRARGVPDQHIETAVEEAAANSDEAAMVRQRIDRKLRLFRGEIDDKKIASLYRTLLRAGFSSDTIRRELKRATTEDLPEVESPDETSSGGF